MLPKFRKILYCTDLSKGSHVVFKHAISIAKETNADVHILHVVEKLSSDARITLKTYIMDSDSRRDFLNERVSHSKEKLIQRQETFWADQSEGDQHVRKRIKELKVVEGYPAESILKTSKALEVDLIIMGTHEKGIMHTFLGSVAKDVLSRSRIPVMIVPLPDYL